MIFNKKMKELGAMPFSSKESNVDNTAYINYLSQEHFSLLNYYKSAIIFDNSALFEVEIDRCPPNCDDDRCISIEMLYSIEKNEQSIAYRNRNKSDIFPELDKYIFIGDSTGGDQICLHKTTGEIYYWYHEGMYETEELYFLSSNFSDFIQKIKVNEDELNTTIDVNEVKITIPPNSNFRELVENWKKKNM